ncbi:MAG: undecaprenyl-diphosphate phosphatase [Dysgonamonadaceae bacterium]|jgi:undecaprenyl-diphosphatase|nr:undecaprenyl-diphosphate phosphatase [Dysgonamonadaceae bacterium]
MDWLEAVIIATVEGLTEFLPVSSTGHMILAQGFMGITSDEFVKAFTVIIQFGAILSVLILYWRRFLQSLDFYWKLLIAFLPAAVFGFLFSDAIDALLENVEIVAVMLIVGGVFMLFADQLFAQTSANQNIGWRKALIIGLCQCIAMIPGVSRSMATIAGGMSQKLTRKNAAEFSFFLAVPTMAAASGYKMLKLFLDDSSRELLLNNINILIAGNIVAFVVALLAIKVFISFLTKYGFKAFGYYRIAAGAIILIMLACGYNLQIA